MSILLPEKWWYKSYCTFHKNRKILWKYRMISWIQRKPYSYWEVLYNLTEKFNIINAQIEKILKGIRKSALDKNPI